MALSIGQIIQSAGCVTRLQDIIGREPNELEQLIGYHRGRLAQGYYIAVLKERLQPGEFNFAGYTHLSGGKYGLPDPQKRQAVNDARINVHDNLRNNIGQSGIDAQQRQITAAIPLTGVERLAKCMPKIMHSDAMEKDPSLPLQYPRGDGIKQYILTVKKNFLIAAEVDPGGAIRGMNNFASRIAANVAYEQRMAVRRYLEAV